MTLTQQPRHPGRKRGRTRELLSLTTIATRQCCKNSKLQVTRDWCDKMLCQHPRGSWPCQHPCSSWTSQKASHGTADLAQGNGYRNPSRLAASPACTCARPAGGTPGRTVRASRQGSRPNGAGRRGAHRKSLCTPLPTTADTRTRSIGVACTCPLNCHGRRQQCEESSGRDTRGHRPLPMEGPRGSQHCARRRLRSSRRPAPLQTREYPARTRGPR